jgi:hypothetical protein
MPGFSHRDQCDTTVQSTSENVDQPAIPLTGGTGEVVGD